MAMKRSVRDKWCAALRSGEYKQGRDKLFEVLDWNEEESFVEPFDAYCCLGVLQGPVLGFPLDKEWQPAHSLMHPKAAKTAGLPAPKAAQFNDIAESNLQKQLGELNSDLSFPAIADWIEANVPVEEG